MSGRQLPWDNGKNGKAIVLLGNQHKTFHMMEIQTQAFKLLMDETINLINVICFKKKQAIPFLENSSVLKYLLLRLLQLDLTKNSQY